MTISRRAVAPLAAAMLAMLAGCEAEQPRRTGFLHNNPWVVKKPGQAGAATASAANPVVRAGGGDAAVTTLPRPGGSYLEGTSPNAYKLDTEIVSPILEAKGNWTVRLAFYNPTPATGHSALFYANQHTRELRRKGYDAYITDFLSRAIVSVGAFDAENDPKMIELWRQSYEDWLKIYGGRKSPFREAMEQFYGNETVFGDQPWPVSIIDLQIKMKGAYKIPLTEEDKARYKEYIRKRVKTGENP